MATQATERPHYAAIQEDTVAGIFQHTASRCPDRVALRTLDGSTEITWAEYADRVRKVAAGDNFISPQLAEAVTFSGASIKANPATQMTAREREILRLLGRGDKIVEVADALEISYKTVANTTSLLKQKLGAKNHSDLIRIAVEMGLG